MIRETPQPTPLIESEKTLKTYKKLMGSITENDAEEE